MSKTTKIIAALGVVAGLGVAALPAFTYAQASVTGTADVLVDVQPAIAMTIEGNNDTATGYGVAKAKNPGSINALDTLTSTDLASFSDTNATTVSSSIASLLPNSSVHGGTTTGATDFKSTITVYTNSVSGYNLGISALTNLVQQGVSGTPEAIAPSTIVKAGTSAWGYAVNTPVAADSDGETPNYAIAANTAIDHLDTKTTNGHATNVYYGVSTSPDQATGTYKSTVTYTATTK